MTNPENTKNTDYEEVPLETGEKVRVYSRPATRINLQQEIDEASPLATALIKLSDGRSVIANRRAMVMLGQPSKTGYFIKDEKTTGAKLTDLYPSGVPEIEIDKQWADIGVVERVAIRPHEPYEYKEYSSLEYGNSMFESAEFILKCFEMVAFR